MNHPRNPLRTMAGLIALIVLLWLPRHSVPAAVSPLIAGNATDDSVRVAVSVNDTLGNAADADTIILIWMWQNLKFDSTIVTGPGYRTGQYLIDHVSSNGGLTGDYRVLVRARVQGRTPITNYAYQVVPGGLFTLASLTDSNLARAATAEDYRADVSACGPGSGAIPCTLYTATVVGVDTLTLQGVFIRAYNESESETAARGTTDADGRVIFALEEATYHAYGYQTGYAFAPLPETVTVGATGVADTLWATAFDPGLPATANLCRVYGWVYNLGGDTLSGTTVKARILESPLRYQNIVISPYELTTTTDTAGYWHLDLFPSSRLIPDTTRYEFTIRYASGAILRRTVAVPDSAQWLLTW